MAYFYDSLTTNNSPYLFSLHYRDSAHTEFSYLVYTFTHPLIKAPKDRARDTILPSDHMSYHHCLFIEINKQSFALSEDLFSLIKKAVIIITNINKKKKINIVKKIAILRRIAIFCWLTYKVK